MEDENRWINIQDMIWQNDLIPDLNYDALIDNVQLENMRIYAGNGSDTLALIGVHNSTGEDWADGIPHEIPPEDPRQFRPGDATVLPGSARLGDINVIQGNVEHQLIPHRARDHVVNFITGQEQAIAEVSGELLDTEKKYQFSINSLLFIGTRSNILMGLKTREGSHVGRFPDIDNKVSEIDNYYYRGNEQKTAALGIYNLEQGEYVLTITTKEPRVEYEIYVSYKNKTTGRKDKTKIRGFITGNKTKKHIIRIGKKLKTF